MRFNAFQRVRLGTLPTPLHELPYLSAALGGPRIFIKRDDLTGLALGGNKTRMLEYLIGDALSQAATHIITEGGPQSNHVRQTLAAARIHGLEAVIVQNPINPEPEVQGNFLLDRLLDISFEQVQTEHERSARMEEIAARLRREGSVPYIIPGGGSNEVGSIGYVAAMLELQRQVWEQGLNPSALYFASGGGGTQAGIALGAAIFHCDFAPIGIAIEDDGATVAERAWRIIERTAERLALEPPLRRDDLICRDGHVGPGYAIPTEECIEAIGLLARTEAIFLEPIYTAKAFAGMLAAVRRGEHGPDEQIVFLHTGGAPVLFALVDQLAGAIG
jgi:D-cysteine desulfhydrase family pyridoxal phosphate-dependent enzyme